MRIRMSLQERLGKVRGIEQFKENSPGAFYRAFTIRE
jgi:hypothetical protein